MMKHSYLKVSASLKFLFAVSLFLFLGIQEAQACHGVAIVTPVGTVSGTDITITGSSDAATCGCGPYWMEVELTCNPTGFTGTPPIPSSSAWGTEPWYHSVLNPPAAEACVVEPYFPIVIPFAQLCPGTTYYWRVREFVENSTSGAGPWSTTFSFTTPGLPPSAILSTTSNDFVTAAAEYSGCPGDLFQFNANVTGGCPGANVTYTWTPATGLNNPNIANPVCTLGVNNITYTVTATGGCFTVTTADDTVRLNVGPPPIAGTASAAPDTMCSGQSAQVVLSGYAPGPIQWQVSPNGINWFNVPGGTNDTINTGPLNSTLIYQAIVTGTGWPGGTGCGTSASQPDTVTVAPSPVASAGTSTSVCSGGCTNLTGSGGVTYTWQPGNLSGQTVNVCPPGTTTYTLLVTDANGCSDSDQVTISVSIPTVNVSPAVSICAGNTTVLVASGPSGQTYSWQPAGSLTGANTANPTSSATVTTTYTVTATNQFGCTDVDSVTVTVTTAPPLTLSNDTSLCNGGVATLSVSGAATYTWQPGNLTGSSVTVSPVTTTTYVVTGNTNNCIAVDTVIVTVAPPLSVYAGPDFDVCAGTQITMNVGVTGGTYTWLPSSSIIGSNTSQSVTAQPNTTTSYTVNVTDANGCISADTITVTVNNLPVVNATTTDNSICAGATTSLSASGATAYQWIPTVGVQNPNQATTNAVPTTTTTYSVVGTDANGCTDTSSVTITINPLPVVYMIPVPTECGDSTGQITLGGVIAGTGPFTYQIGTQTYNSLPITGLNGGTYVVTTTDANGCTSSGPVVINTVNTASVNASANPTNGVYPLPVGFTSTGSSGVNTYLWSFGDAGATAPGSSATYTYGSPGTYEVILTAYNDNPACAVYDTIYITVVEQATLALPNIFTPNNDANNDQFSATISGVEQISVEIFNRWGNKVHSFSQGGISPIPSDLPVWDGKSNGKVAEDGVYYYSVIATGYDGKQYPASGFVHLITAKQ